MNNPFAKIFLALMARIEAAVPEIKHIDHDMGQIDGYSTRPSVAFPLVLTDFAAWTFSNLSTNAQSGEGDVIIKLGFAQFNKTDNLTGAVYREEALGYYELEWKLHKALEGWSPGDEFGLLTRTSVVTENKPMAVRVRTITYRLGFEDYSSQDAPLNLANPQPNLAITN